MSQRISPILATKAGNRAGFELSQKVDPVDLAMTKWNQELVLAGTKPEGSEEPVLDGRAYTVVGVNELRCRPFVKVAWREGFQPGPEVRFEERDDGLHLTVVFVEDPSQRAQNALPFDVSVKHVRIRYGPAEADQMDFKKVVQEPLDPKSGPAFQILCDVLVPNDERRARLVAAMQSAGRANWELVLEFLWVRIIPPDPTRPVRPGPIRPDVVLVRPGVAIQPAVVARVPNTSATARDDTQGGAAVRGAAVMRAPPHGGHAFTGRLGGGRLTTRPDLIGEILVAPVRPAPQPSREEKIITIPRPLVAEYPKGAPANRPVYAAVDGDYVQAGWRKVDQGWFQPTPIQDTVYVLPHAYVLHVDEVTGLPSIQALLMRKSDAGELVDDLDPRQYKMRLTLKVSPEFDQAKLDALRAVIRAETSNHIKYADLVLGGYKAAKFVPDPSLVGLGELFGGSSAGERDKINPAESFTVTYEGNGEFIDALFKRLIGPGIDGSVQIDLEERGGTTRTESIPVSLTLRRLAQIALPVEFVMPEPSQSSPANLIELFPRALVLRNPTQREVSLGGVQAYALGRLPATRRVIEYAEAKTHGVSWPVKLEPAVAVNVSLQIDAADAVFNSWDIGLLDCRTSIPEQLVLNELFDAATSGVRGWKVDLDCPPLEFFDRLSPEEQAKVNDVVAIEVEIRRLGSKTIDEVRLTRQQPKGSVLLSRTVSDFISDRSVGRSTFEYCQRIVRLTRAEDPTPWRQETGRHLSVFLA